MSASFDRSLYVLSEFVTSSSLSMLQVASRRYDRRHKRLCHGFRTSPQSVVRSTSCLVIGWGFRVRRIEWHYFQNKTKVAAAIILEKF